MAKSLQTFREWAVAQGGNIGNPGVNTFRGECVSLVQQYINQVFDVPYAARGNAKDYTPPTAKFKAMGTKVALQPGDIVRYGNIGNAYGHIEMIDDEGKALSQNRGGRRKVERNSVLPGYSQVFRPVVPFTIKTPAPAPDPSTGGMPPVGSRVKILPGNDRTTYRAGTTNVAGKIHSVNDNFVYIVRGYDPKFPGRIIINTASGGGNGVALALYYTNGQIIPGWVRI